MGCQQNATIDVGDVVQCGDFRIDLNVVTEQQLTALRQALPKDEYKLIKDRKTARLRRRKRSKEHGALLEQLNTLQEDQLERDATIN